MVKSHKYVFVTVIAILFLGCHMHKPAFPLLDYSWSSNWQYSYSLKIDDNGKAFLKKNDLQTDSFFVKTEIDTKEINKLMSGIAQAKLDSQYIQNNIEDAASFEAMIYPQNAVPSKFKVYGNNYPEQLKKLEHYCRQLSEQKSWICLKDTTITFDSYHPIPKPNVKNVKFPPPTKEVLNR